jgi:hypothetical protein
MKGNCVDKFIKKRVDISLYKIKSLLFNIDSRNYIRSVNADYFNTLCYEKDFNDIIKLRDEAKLLVDNCNKFLERISEQYSKLN